MVPAFNGFTFTVGLTPPAVILVLIPFQVEWPFKSQAAQLVGAVSSLDFCIAQPHDFCASAGTRLHVFDGTSSAVKRQISRFKDKAYSGSFRRDGRLIVAGGEDGVVQVRPCIAATLRPPPMVPCRIKGGQTCTGCWLYSMLLTHADF